MCVAWGLVFPEQIYPTNLEPKAVSILGWAVKLQGVVRILGQGMVGSSKILKLHFLDESVFRLKATGSGFLAVLVPKP